MNKRNRQKLKFLKGRKFSEPDIWNLGYTLARDAAKGLRMFQNQDRIAHPIDLTPEKWDSLLEEMEWALREISEDYPHSPMRNFSKKSKESWEELKIEQEKYNERLKSGLIRFAERLPDLWW